MKLFLSLAVWALFTATQAAAQGVTEEYRGAVRRYPDRVPLYPVVVSEGRQETAQTTTGSAHLTVVRLTSHGGSATVIWTGPGRSILLSCGHAFQGERRGKKIVADGYWPEGANLVPGPMKLLTVDYEADLSLIAWDVGPWPWVAPVAALGTHPSARCWSIGYDEQGGKQVYTWKWAQLCTTFTREKPWHGRSGGALIDPATGQLYGVVQGYETNPGGRGMYVSLDTIHRFLAGERSRRQPQMRQMPAPCPGGS